MFVSSSVEIFDWYGLNNPNTCLLSYFNSQGAGKNRNLGFCWFPLNFWKHIGFKRYQIGLENKRIYIGIGIFSIFWDRQDLKNKN